MVDGDSTGRWKTAGVFLMKESACAKARDRRKYFLFCTKGVLGTLKVESFGTHSNPMN